MFSVKYYTLLISDDGRVKRIAGSGENEFRHVLLRRISPLYYTWYITEFYFQTPYFQTPKTFRIYFTLICDLSGSEREPNNIRIRWKWLLTFKSSFDA